MSYNSHAAEISAASEVIIGRHPNFAGAIREASNACIQSGATPADFNARCLEILRSPAITPAALEQRRDGASIGMNSREVARYSFLRAILRQADGGPVDGLEREASDAVAQKLGRSPRGFFLPDEVVTRSVALARGRAATRGLLAGSPADGGYSVPEESLSSQFVELLRNQSHVIELGGRVIGGLVGNVSIPRQLTGATCYWVSETGSITQSSATFGQIAVRPRQIGTSIQYSKQFLAQTSLDAEAFVIADSTAAHGVELDRAALRGTGGAEPLGVLSLASADRSTSVTFGGAATYAKVLEFEANLAANNSITGNPAWITTPAVRAKWKALARIAAAGADPVWDNDRVAGYRARATNQLLSATNLAILGDWSQVLFCQWSGLDVVVDPYSGKKEGLVEVTISRLIDIAIRNGKSFCVSTDSGAQ